MNLWKKVVVYITLLTMLIGANVISASAAVKAPKLTIDGVNLSILSTYGKPYIDSANRMLVPIRIVSEQLGAKVSWDAKSQTATIDSGIRIKAGATEVTTPYGSVKMDTKAVIRGSRLYIPIRYLCNALGYQIESNTKDGVPTANIVTKAEITVSAAASLKNAIEEVKALYLVKKPNTNLIINLGSSGALAQQIEQGAVVDIFFPASSSNMSALKDKGLMDNNTITDLLANRVVLVVPNDSKIAIDAFTDVTDKSIRKIALGEPKSVPAGQYAEEVFTKYNILDQVKAKTVYGKDVREVLSWVETGNVDAGVVYSTDAKVSTKVKVIAVAPRDSHTPVVYPAGILKDSKSKVAAADFMNFLSGQEAIAVFEKYGFSTK